MKHLSAVHKYFWKYRVRLFAGIVFVIASNYFGVLAPEITGFVVNKVQEQLPGGKTLNASHHYNTAVLWFVNQVSGFDYGKLLLICSITILILALLRGTFMFIMRQTLVVMSRYIEYDMKNAVYNHYQQLDASFFKQNRTGDLMNRIAEDVSRVRMYTGPAVMYFVNLVSLIVLCLFNMFNKDAYLTWIVIAPLPILAITIYFVNTIIHKKSERVQSSLSDMTTNAQESYSGIRVIKSFVQEKAMLLFFKKNSERYRNNAVGLAKVEAIYFPSMTLLIGLSTLLTIYTGSKMALDDPQKLGIIAEFVIYINMLMFPVTAIGSVASMVQRAAASQKRLNEFMQTEPAIQSPENVKSNVPVSGDIAFEDISYTYTHTGIQSLQHLRLTIKEGEKVLILGRTGSGKSTLLQMLMRFFDADEGGISIGGRNIKNIPLKQLRNSISYVPQDVFLFSDTVANNISFGLEGGADKDKLEHATKLASIHKEILSLENGYETMVGERGVTLSGGQKQRISIARALIKDVPIILFDDCLSAVDAKTENNIINNLYEYMGGKTALLVTHRIFTVLNFDKIVVMDEGQIIEEGTHETLLAQNGYYAELYQLQVTSETGVD